MIHKSDKQRESRHVPTWINAGYQKQRYQEESAQHLRIALEAEQKIRQIHPKRNWKIVMAVTLAAALAIGLYAGYATTAVEKPVTVEVQQGDTIWDIAARHSRNTEDIRQVCWQIIQDNNLDSDCVIQPGQLLVLK